MIWNKGCFSAVGALATRYAPIFEYMFVFVKGRTWKYSIPLKISQTRNAGKPLAGTAPQCRWHTESAMSNQQGEIP